MPFFKWYAIDAQSRLKKGVMFARTISIVQDELRKQKFVLVAQSSFSPLISYRILAQERVACFRRLGWLLSKGIRLIDALAIAAQGARHVHVRRILQDCTEAISEGMQFSEVALCHSEFFNGFCCRMIMVGEYSGSLAQSCTDMAAYADIMATFSQKVREALFAPCVTLGVFIGVLLVLLYTVIPRFGAILKTIPGALPARTQAILAVSAWLRSPAGLVTMGTFCALIVLCVWLGRKYVRCHGATLLSYVPLLRVSVEDLSAALFFRTLSSLVGGGSHITHALTVASSSVASSVIRDRYERVSAEVAEGIPLSVALPKHIPSLAAECITVLHIGEATGRLGAMTEACANLYQERVVRWCRLMSRLVQPILLLLLGFLVGLLLLTLYEPILSLGSLVT